MGVDVCDLLKPVYAEDSLLTTRMGYFVEISAKSNALAGLAEGGLTVATDMYHHQLKIGYYSGHGLKASAGFGAGVKAVAGMVFGYDKGVKEFQGHFSVANASFGLPYVKDFIHGEVGLMTKAKDVNGSGTIELADEDHLVKPPKGLYGGFVGVGAGVKFDPLLGHAPVAPSFLHAKHSLHRKLTKAVYEKLDGRRFNMFDINARLIQPSGKPCPETWPEAENGSMSTKKCVITFGSEDESHISRGLQMAGALCGLTGRCSLPQAWPAAMHSIAIGAIRDKESDITEMCK